MLYLSKPDDALLQEYAINFYVNTQSKMVALHGLSFLSAFRAISQELREFFCNCVEDMHPSFMSFMPVKLRSRHGQMHFIIHFVPEAYAAV